VFKPPLPYTYVVSYLTIHFSDEKFGGRDHLFHRAAKRVVSNEVEQTQRHLVSMLPLNANSLHFQEVAAE